MEHVKTCPHCGQPMPAEASAASAGRSRFDCQGERPLRHLRVARLAADVLERGRERRRMQAQAAASPRPPVLTPCITLTGLLRYLEVAWGVDVERARREIMTPAICDALRAGASAVLVNGCKLKAVDGRIVAVFGPERSRPKPLRAPKARREATAIRNELQTYFEELAEGLVK